MEIIIRPSQAEASLIGARIVAALIRKKPHAVLGFATGNTPLELYRNLIRFHREEGLDFSRTTSFNLDEYVGIPPEHPGSFHSYMAANLFRGLNIPPENINIPDGLAADIPAYCLRYEEDIRSAGGIDIQILGIGTNGHVGYNEPSSSLASRTRIKTLTEQTMAGQVEFFGDLKSVPCHAITMGLGTILESRTCLLLAFGKPKARAVAQTVEGPVTTMVPASVLQLHPRAVILVDEEAASELEKADYYRWVYDRKPDWQKY